LQQHQPQQGTTPGGRGSKAGRRREQRRQPEGARPAAVGSKAGSRMEQRRTPQGARPTGGGGQVRQPEGASPATAGSKACSCRTLQGAFVAAFCSSGGGRWQHPKRPFCSSGCGRLHSGSICGDACSRCAAEVRLLAAARGVCNAELPCRGVLVCRIRTRRCWPRPGTLSRFLAACLVRSWGGRVGGSGTGISAHNYSLPW
jgi:hypothetical protein